MANFRQIIGQIHQQNLKNFFCNVVLVLFANKQIVKQKWKALSTTYFKGS